MSFADHYSEGAESYARHRPTYPPALAAALAGLAPAHDLAWEAGCGSGQLSVLLGERFGRVVACDASAAQVEHATPHPRVEYRVALAHESGLPDRSVDLAVAAQAAHWFDTASYWTEVERVGRPGSAVALVTYGRVDLAGGAGRVMDRFYDDVLGGWWPAERRHVEAGYRDLPFPFTEVEVRAPPMTAEWDVDAMLGYVATWSAVRSMEKALGVEPFAAFAEELRKAWGPGRRSVRWPLTVRAGRVRAGRPG